MLVAIIISLLAGSTLVISRVANAKLATKTNALTSTFYNYLIGLIVSFIALLLLGQGELPLAAPYIANKPWIYLGGLLSVFVVFIAASAATKIPVFHLTLLIFVGQLFASLVIDTLITHHFSLKQLIGGLFVTFGFTLNLLLDTQKATAKNLAQAE